MTTYQIDTDDDIFARPPRAVARKLAETTRIKCAVCDKPATIPAAAPGKLCDLCRSDLAATAQHIQDVRSVVYERLRDAQARFDADYAHADEMDQLRFDNVTITLQRVKSGEVSKAAYDKNYAAALEKGDGLSTILRSLEAMQNVASEALGQVTWAKAALVEVRAAMQDSAAPEPVQRAGEYALPPNVDVVD